MSRTAKVIPFQGDSLVLEADWLHEGQREVYNSPARFKVVVCGRQWGKTSLAALMCVEEGAVRGGRAWWVAPHYKEGEEAWGILRYLCKDIPGKEERGRPNYEIMFPSGGRVQVRSAEDPQALRGATLSGLVLDEAAQINREAWEVVLQPTLAVSQGWATFISTPKGLDWFYDLYRDAEGRPNWQTWRFPSYMNPSFPMAEWERAKSEMHPLIFAQEHEAEFVQASGTMFKREWFRYYRVRDGMYVPIVERDHSPPVKIEDCKLKFATVDLAYSVEERADYTVISSWAVTPKGQLLLLDVIRGHYEAPDLIPQMKLAFVKHHLGYLVVEKASRGTGIIRDAERAGLPIRPVTADRNKELRALPAAARMEREQILFPAGAPWMKDLEDEVLAFPAGRHDDFVDTLAYAVLRVGASEKGYLMRLD